jgi:hypothetical protein
LKQNEEQFKEENQNLIVEDKESLNNENIDKINSHFLNDNLEEIVNNQDINKIDKVIQMPKNSELKEIHENFTNARKPFDFAFSKNSQHKG